MTSQAKLKEELIQELNQILQIRNIRWDLLPESDLLRLFEAFLRLKFEVEQVFGLVDELENTIAELSFIIEKNTWKEYVI